MSRTLETLFSRTTTSGSYIRELDGLRFIAIASVICVHITGIWTASVGRTYDDMGDIARVFYRMTLLGGYGVELFFMISGFVLAIPFCQNALAGGRPVDLRKYFWRRVTRLEPPYLVSMLFFFIMMPLWGKGSYGELFPNLLASLAYLHNAIYNVGSVINNNAWSLEVEVQFYLLVPLILTALSMGLLLRRTVMVLAVIGFSLHPLWLQENFPVSILQFFQFFALGILFCDLRTTDWSERPSSTASDLPAFLALPAFFWVNLTQPELARSLANPWLIALFFYSALWGKWHSRLLSWGWLPIVGGMCYSIYLLHARILSLVLHHGFSRFELTGNFPLDFGIIFAGSLPPVILLSALFFLLIEKPCMNPRWPQDLWGVLGNFARRRGQNA